MRKTFLWSAFLAASFFSHAQSYEIDRLKKQLNEHPQQDTFRVNRLVDICNVSPRISNEEMEKFAAEALSLAHKLNYTVGIGNALVVKARAGLCFISGKEIVIGDLGAEYGNYLQKMPTPIEGNQPASLIYLPLKVKDKMFGVITVQSFRKNAFSDYHLNMLRTIAIYTAIALENAEAFKKLNVTVNSLKDTQKQLIQSEKMASLGELTTGIAHEIQNPLNFVNNFSEVNTELIDELKKELAVGNKQLAEELAKDIKANSEKINHHGKRGGDIVKGMLQHSRSSSGVKELTDINALADEYLRLAYHGLRAKDKSFNAIMKTDFDETIGKINIISQDMVE